MNAKMFENPALKTRIKSSSVKIQEMAFGYLIAPFCAMISNAIFGSYLNRYYVDVQGWTKLATMPTEPVVAATWNIDLIRREAKLDRSYRFAKRLR